MVWKKLSNLKCPGASTQAGFTYNEGLWVGNWLIGLRHRPWELKFCVRENLCLWPDSRTSPASAHFPFLVLFSSSLLWYPSLIPSISPLLEMIADETAFLN